MKKTTKEEIIEAVRNAGNTKKIEIAPQDLVEEYEDECYEFIERVFKVKCALITDESRVGDFPKLKEDWRRITMQMFGIPCPEKNALIVDVAMAIRKARAH